MRLGENSLFRASRLHTLTRCSSAIDGFHPVPRLLVCVCVCLTYYNSIPPSPYQLGHSWSICINYRSCSKAESCIFLWVLWTMQAYNGIYCTTSPFWMIVTFTFTNINLIYLSLMPYDRMQCLGSDSFLKYSILHCFWLSLELRFNGVLYYDSVFSNHLAIFSSPSQMISICGAWIDLDLKISILTWVSVS